MITIDDFAKVELRIGTVLEATDIPGSEKLINQTVDFGELGTRQILSGIKTWYKPSQLIGKQFLYCINLEPRMMMGLESQGMILCAEGSKKPIPLKPSSKAPNGAGIR